MREEGGSLILAHEQVFILPTSCPDALAFLRVKMYSHDRASRGALTSYVHSMYVVNQKVIQLQFTICTYISYGFCSRIRNLRMYTRTCTPPLRSPGHGYFH